MKTKNLLLRICIAIFCFALLSLNSTAQSPNWAWAKSANGTNDDDALSITTDALGNSYAVGYFKSSSISFGSTILTNIGGADMFIVKYDASGNVLWARSAGGSGGDYANSVATDALGNSYVAGYFQSSTITFGLTTLTNAGGGGGNYGDVFIVKYDVSGNVLWAKSFGGDGDDGEASISTDGSGNSYLIGYIQSSSVNFGSHIMINSGAGYSNRYLVKYDASGNDLWAILVGLSYGAGNYVTSVASDASGNSYVTGYFKSSLTFGGTTLVASGPGGAAIFIVKNDVSGNNLWAKRAGGSGVNSDGANSIAVDASGNSYVVGFFQSPTITFGSTILTSIGGADMYIVKYDASGNVLWAKSAGGTNVDGANSIAVDPLGNSYVVGFFYSASITFGSIILTNAGGEDVFIVKYDSSGNLLWAKNAGGSSNETANSVAIDASDNSYVAGYFNSPSITFGSTNLTNSITSGSSSDLFIAKLNTVTGVESLENTEGVNIYPNPSTGKYIIALENKKGLPETGMIEIYNVMGEIIYNSAFQQLNNTTIDISEKPNGVYFLSIISNNEKRTIKILKY